MGSFSPSADVCSENCNSFAYLVYLLPLQYFSISYQTESNRSSVEVY